MVQDQVRRGEYELTNSQESLISSFKSKCSDTVITSHALELNTTNSLFQQQDILSICHFVQAKSFTDVSAEVDRGFWSRTPRSFLANEKEIQLKTTSFKILHETRWHSSFSWGEKTLHCLSLF